MRRTKAFKAYKRDAGIAYQQGDRKKAYELWERAAKGYQTLKKSRTDRRRRT